MTRRQDAQSSLRAARWQNPEWVSRETLALRDLWTSGRYHRDPTLIEFYRDL
jgi:hypothetical protein